MYFDSLNNATSGVPVRKSGLGSENGLRPDGTACRPKENCWNLSEGGGNIQGAVTIDALSSGAGMNEWVERERLHRAAEAGDAEVVRELLQHGCLVNTFDDLGKTPLHYAVRGEHFAVVQILLRAGADINAHDERLVGDTPLAEAVPTCSLRMARMLVQAGADPAIQGWMQLSALDRAEHRKRKRSERTGSEGRAIYDLLREAVRKRKG